MDRSDLEILESVSVPADECCKRKQMKVEQFDVDPDKGTVKHEVRQDSKRDINL